MRCPEGPEFQQPNPAGECRLAVESARSRCCLSGFPSLRPVRRVADLGASGGLTRAMSLAPEITERVQAVEHNLALLDPVLHYFCRRHGYTFRGMVDLYPQRRAWRREEIDRCLDLTLDLTVSEVVERGFYPDMPWSLYASASLLPTVREAARILSADVFRGVPYSQLATVLEPGLEDGLAMLRTFKRQDIIERGQTYGHAA